ncbi:MAG: hypothetical protein U5Q03_13590 [Bacteroidota bacterium]|nr:hypothetical protein [Bacteroidota bacterium]
MVQKAESVFMRQMQTKLSVDIIEDEKFYNQHIIFNWRGKKWRRG